MVRHSSVCMQAQQFKSVDKISLSGLTLVFVPSFHPAVSDKQHTATRGTCTEHLSTAALTPGKA